MIVWVDCETTSLDERTGALLEVGIVATDDKLDERGAMSVIVAPFVGALDAMPLVVREMHEKSGLLADLVHGVPLVPAEEKLIAQLGELFGRIEDLRQIPLAGSTVSFDRRWLRAHMPKLEALFSYRSIDVSSLTELASRWAPSVYANRPKAEKGKAHRVLDDVRASIAFLKYYRACNFVRVSCSKCGGCGSVSVPGELHDVTCPHCNGIGND